MALNIIRIASTTRTWWVKGRCDVCGYVMEFYVRLKPHQTHETAVCQGCKAEYQINPKTERSESK